jgi:hypothetical protein
MSTDDRQKAKRNPPPNTPAIATFIGATAIILVAVITNFRDPLGRAFGNVATTAPTPTPSTASASPAAVTVDMPATVEETLSPAAELVDQYYRYINGAHNSDELGKAWSLATLNFKCNPSDRCNFVQYQDYWWQFKLQYKLYDCGADTIDSELIYYARKAAGPIASARPEYLRYKLIEDNGQLKLNSADAIEQIGADCKLAVSVP